MIDAKKIVKILNKKYNVQNIDVAIVLGSGLIESAPDIQNPQIVNYTSLKMPGSKIKGHSGRFVFGTYNGKNIALVSRYHFYESGDMQKVRLPYEILSLLNTKVVILMTASGGINKTFKPGDIMFIKDHINFTGNNPLINIEKQYFVPMGNAYNADLFNKLESCAKSLNIVVRQGVHIQFLGPTYETQSEIEVSRLLGADSVSMSTALDCIVCNHFKIKVAGIACITNAYSESSQNVTHDEVLNNAKIALSNIKSIVSLFLNTIDA